MLQEGHTEPAQNANLDVALAQAIVTHRLPVLDECGQGAGACLALGVGGVVEHQCVDAGIRQPAVGATRAAHDHQRADAVGSV